jgi:thioredoxin reductase
MSSHEHADLLILGGGPAGYAAAFHAARADLRPLLVCSTIGEDPAGAPNDAWSLDADAALGPTLKERLREHAERASTRVVFDRIKAVHLGRRPFALDGEAAGYTCEALIVAVDTLLDTRMFAGQLDLRDGRIVRFVGLSGMATMTSRRGVFVAGDLDGLAVGQVVTGPGSGCMAALDAQRFLGL